MTELTQSPETLEVLIPAQRRAPREETRNFWPQVRSFAIIGGSLAVAYCVLYLAFGFLGSQWSNLVALTVTTAANIILNRKFTFKSKTFAWRDYTQSGIVFLIALTLTALTLNIAPRIEMLNAVPTVLLALGANLSATALRFTLLRHWVYRHLKVS